MGGENRRADEGRVETRGHSRGGEQTDRYGNEDTRETTIPSFSFTSSLYLPFKKRESGANKTFIIPGKLFNVFDIKRLKGERERDEKGERMSGSW